MTKPPRARTYLEGASYAMRDHAKEHGARWDRERKAWYVLGDVPEMLADLVAAPEGEDSKLDLALDQLGAAVRSRQKAQPKPTLRAAPFDDAQADFFVPALYDISGKENRSTMDVAVFRLSKKDHRAGELMRYELSDGYVEVTGGPKGMASVWDYDIVLMAISQLTEAMNRYRAGQGEKPGRRFRPHIADILKFCRKGDGGRQVTEVEASLDRLRSTTIKIVRHGTGKNGRPMRAVEAEGLINNYRAVSFTDTDKMAAVEIELPNWIYQHVVEANKPDVLTVHRDYFLIEQGLARFIYRLARRAAGKGEARWSFKTLYERSGSTGTLKKFTFTLRALIAADDLPEYRITEEKGQDGPLLLMTYRNGGTPELEGGV